MESQSAYRVFVVRRVAFARELIRIYRRNHDAAKGHEARFFSCCYYSNHGKSLCLKLCNTRTCPWNPGFSVVCVSSGWRCFLTQLHNTQWHESYWTLDVEQKASGTWFLRHAAVRAVAGDYSFEIYLTATTGYSNLPNIFSYSLRSNTRELRAKASVMQHFNKW